MQLAFRILFHHDTQFLNVNTKMYQEWIFKKAWNIFTDILCGAS